MSFKNEISFANDLFQLLETPSSCKSVVFSPTSILNGLAIAYIGATGATAAQISNIIDKEKSKEELIEYYSKSANRNTQDRGMLHDYLKVVYVNQLFINVKHEVKESFCQKYREKFGQMIQKIDFQKQSVAALKINHSIYEASNGKIKNVIRQNEIHSETSIILVNTLNFIAPWKDEFHNPKLVTFNSNPPKQIEMMITTVVPRCNWNFVESNEWESLGIPFQDYKAWMYIVLPKKEDGLPKLLENINYDNFKLWTKRSINRSMVAKIPKMNEIFDFPLKEILKKLGITNAFDDNADFGDLISDDCPAKIDHIVHSTSLTIDEQGIGGGKSMTEQYESCHPTTKMFFATHPFLYFVITCKPSLLHQATTPLELLFIGTFC